MTQEYPISEAACEFRFIHASGPGGQHVNKTSTAVELRVAVNLLGLPPGPAQRLRDQQRNRISRQGQIVIQADQHRSQLKNRKVALERLQRMIQQALPVPKKRIATKPTKAARRRRLDNKRQRGQTKSARRKPTLD